MTTAAPDVQFVDYEKAHGDYIAKNMRLSDRKEMYYMAAIRPAAAVEMSVAMAREVKTVLLDGVPCLVFGIGTQTFFSEVGVPWLLGTDAADQHQYRFGRQSKKIFSEMYAPYSCMENHVLAENKKTIRWLKWLGFEMDEPLPYGVFNQEFIRFGKGL